MTKCRKLFTTAAGLLLSLCLLLETGMSAQASEDSYVEKTRGGVTAVFSPGSASSADVVNATARELNLDLTAQEEEPEETQAEEELLNYMDDVLRQRVFSDLEQDRFVHIMERAAEELFKKDAAKLTAGQYESVCLRLLEIGDTEMSEKWCLRQAAQYPEQLSSFTCKLKLYFTLWEREKFFQTWMS